MSKELVRGTTLFSLYSAIAYILYMVGFSLPISDPVAVSKAPDLSFTYCVKSSPGASADYGT